MSQLVPCPNCSRHVRLSASHCPFCEGLLDVTALGEQYAPRRSGAQAGVKRAVLFAMGATMAAACSNDSAQAIYGAPVPPGSFDVPTSDDAETGTTEGEGSEQAIYGAPVPPTSSADETTREPVSDGTSVAPSDAGEPSDDGGAPDATVNTSADAATSDDGATNASATNDGAPDGGVLDASVLPDPEPTSVALYGGPPLGN